MNSQEANKDFSTDRAMAQRNSRRPLAHEKYPKKIGRGRYKRYELGGHRNMSPGIVNTREKSEAGEKTFIDLFCGVGGATLGMMQAGLRHIVGIDTSIECIVTQKWNLDNELIMASVTHLPLRVCPGVDIVWGSPPCVGFSTAAAPARKNPKTRERHKKINQLVIDFAKAVMWLAPKFVLFENVPPIKKSWEFKEMVHILRQECLPPYSVTWHDLNAADFGIPQRRIRTFLMAQQQDEWYVVTEYPDTMDYHIGAWMERLDKLLNPQRSLEDLWKYVPDRVDILDKKVNGVSLVNG